MTANVGGSGLHSQWLAVQQAAVDADVVVITEAAPVGAAERFADPDHGEGWVEVGMDECRLSGVSQQSLGHTSSGGVHVMVRRELRGDRRVRLRGATPIRTQGAQRGDAVLAKLVYESTSTPQRRWVLVVAGIYMLPVSNVGARLARPICADGSGCTTAQCVSMHPLSSFSSLVSDAVEAAGETATVVLAGDFNCRLMGPPGARSDRRGRDVSDVLQDSRMVVVNDFQNGGRLDPAEDVGPTHQRLLSRGWERSTLDYIAVSAARAGGVRQCRVASCVLRPHWWPNQYDNKQPPGRLPHPVTT